MTALLALTLAGMLVLLQAACTISMDVYTLDQLQTMSARWSSRSRRWRLALGVLATFAGLLTALWLAVNELPTGPEGVLAALGAITLAAAGWAQCLECVHVWRARNVLARRAQEARPFDAAPVEVTSCTAWKLGRLRQHAERIWIEGAAGGHYDARSEARCNEGGEHLVPEPSCTCGFHAWSSPERAESYRRELRAWWSPASTALLEVELSGDVLEYAEGFRAQTQDASSITLPPCPCGAPPVSLEPVRSRVADVLESRCESCAGPLALSLAEASAHLGVEITSG